MPSVEKDARRNWLRKWGEEHPEHGVELASRQVGAWEFGAHLDWTRFSLGVDAEREYGSTTWPDRLHLMLNLGPLTFAAVRTWNDPADNWPIIGRASDTRVTSPGGGRTDG